MTTNRKPAAVALALLVGLTLTACGRTVSTIDPGTVGAGSSDTTVRPSSPYNEVYKEEMPLMAEPDPAEGPVNLPPIPRAPTTPVAPGQMQVKALATTISTIPARSLGNFRVDLIRSRVTWTPVKGATGYKIYQLESPEGVAPEGQKGKLVLKTPSWLPVAIVGGGLLGVGNLKVGQGYVYTVEALDRAGNVIAAGQDNTSPLQPLAIPTLELPGQNESGVGQTPYFRWAKSNGADGYYTQVFGPVKGKMVLPMWRGFRMEHDSINIQYGQQVDTFPGSKPLQWMAPLNVGTRYGWTVCAIRTDTHDMHTAKAIAKATAPMGYFTP